MEIGVVHPLLFLALLPVFKRKPWPIVRTSEHCPCRLVGPLHLDCCRAIFTSQSILPLCKREVYLRMPVVGVQHQQVALMHCLWALWRHLLSCWNRMLDQMYQQGSSYVLKSFLGFYSNSISCQMPLGNILRFEGHCLP